MRKFNISDRHTVADIGLEIEGDSLAELFRAGAEGMLAIILGDTTPGASTKTIEINLIADSSEQLLVDWLSELLYYFDTDGLIPLDYNFDIEKTDRFMLSGVVVFRIFDRDNETAEHEIKAVTYYKLRIEESGGRFSADVVFDL